MLNSSKQKEKKENKNIYKKLILTFLVFNLTFIFILISVMGARAAIISEAPLTDAALEEQAAGEEKNWLKSFLESAKLKAWKTAGSQALGTAFRKAINKIAFDTASYIGSGGKGQKSMFIPEEWGEYLFNIGDSVVGDFLETLGREGPLKFNLCEPSAGVTFKIGLGLMQERKPKQPACTFSKMRDNWDKFLDDPNFLNNFQDMFNPSSNDLGIALSLHTKMVENKATEEINKKLNRQETGGWAEFTNLDTTRNAFPDEAERRLVQAYLLQNDIGRWTGDAFKDAANVFINQLALTAFNNLMSKIGEGADKFTSPYNWDNLSFFEAGPNRGGVSATKEKFRTLLEPNFTVRGDYDILSELTMCPDPDKAGPTNCVITDNFSSAVADRMTVGQAMKQGYLSANGAFGFISADGLEPKYNEGYPYRSMIILRKFRIIPVGWEIAAEDIRDNRRNTQSLEDLVNCFTADDNYGNAADTETWCERLIDPNWVLKAPLNFCAREGYGPEIVSKQVTGEKEDSQLTISRNNNYCADEQSCIKESSSGACELFGYCTQERRKWNFDSEICEPKYNTCQSFNARDGDDISYLENTLDYTNCSADNVGCQWYCADSGNVTSMSYPLPSGYIAYWNFEDGPGSSILTDIAGGSNGVLTNMDPNADWVSGQSGAASDSALDFQGVNGGVPDEYVDVGTVGSYSNSLTVMAWINTASNKLWQNIIAGDCGDILFTVQAGGWLTLGSQCDSSVTGALSSTIPINNGTWRHVAAVYNGTNVSLYIDGNPDASWPTTSATGTPFVSGSLQIGSTPNNSIEYFNGSIDEVVIYDRVLTPTEIANYAQGISSTQYGWACTAASTGDKMYFDKDVEECDSGSEGCHEFIRTKAGAGVNLLVNSSFEDDLDRWTVGAGVVAVDTTESFYGAQSLSITNTAGSTSSASQIINGILPNETITVSYYVKSSFINDVFDGAWLMATLYSSTGAIIPDPMTGTPWVDNAVIKTPYDGDNTWKRIEFSFITPPATVSLGIEPLVDNQAGTAWFDAIKVERVLPTNRAATTYSDYRDDGLVYQRFLPDYLATSTSCYTNPSLGDYSYLSTALAECYDYSHLCNASEVGCEQYTSVTDGMSVPAKVTASDYCLAECVGFDSYIKGETNYSSQVPNYFIPGTAKRCGASAVGCTEFTNLDKAQAGGEALEYYTYLRQCIKPSVGNCSGFYAWEGDDETGYQLKAFSLQDDGSGEPFVTENDSADCNAAIYALPASDPAYNGDCREFYNDIGQISYHLYKRTLSCSDDCSPYRMTEYNEVTDLNGNDIIQVDCEALSIYPAPGPYPDIDFDPAAPNRVDCIFCKNNGRWDAANNACIYDAISGESQKCAANQSGCYEYTGNTGNNMKVVLVNDFESGSTDGWNAVGGSVVIPSSISLKVGGNSLSVSGGSISSSNNVGVLVEEGKSYIIDFIAMSTAANSSLDFQFENSLGEVAQFSSAVVSSGWMPYTVSLSDLNHEATSSERLIIQGSADFYIDDIKLTEIVDRYFFIKDSWTTPDSCNQDINGNTYPLYMLGCDEYRDRDNDAHYLHNFNELCSDSAVGCEVMIDTNNYSNYDSGIWNDNNIDGICDSSTEPSCVYVSADNFVYATYSQDKSCAEEDKGCRALGLPYEYEAEVAYDTTYLIDDPDGYDSILCVDTEVGCEDWVNEEGSSYYKDPWDMVCEWRQPYGDVYGWYKKQVYRCDTDADGAGDGAYCQKDEHCADGETCALEAVDNIKCTNDSLKTIGYGGPGNVVEQPTIDAAGNWVGLCPVDQSGCSELIDPVSNFSVNIVFNANFSDIDGNGTLGDGWATSTPGPDPYWQEIVLESNTLYIIAVEDGNTATVTSSGANFYELESGTNNFLSGTQLISVIAGGSERAGKIFYTSANTYLATSTVEAANTNGKVEIKKAIIEYQLEENLDLTSCNGIIDIDEGCVLFNKREQNGLSKFSLVYDADNSPLSTGGPDNTCATDICDSNQLIKAVPDRICGQWLSCQSMVAVKDEEGREQNVCFDIGLCDSVDDNGNCDSSVITRQENQAYPFLVDANAISNFSGYSEAGLFTGSLNNDYFPFSEMEQEGEFADVSNGSFEIAGDNGYPIGWTWPASIPAWNSNLYKVIDNPYTAKEVEGVNYAPDGGNFLKLGAPDYSATSEYITVTPSIDYYLTAYLNTINLSDGSAKIKYQEYLFDGSTTSPEMLIPAMDLEPGSDWTFKIGKITTTGSASRIKIILYTDPPASVVGKAYFDGITMRPALYSKTNGAAVQWYTPQSCRLYPEDDSLSCEYFTDSGMKAKGWRGYCLEYDRYPGSPDACVQWWPVAKVKADGIEEGGGYSDRFPLYMCLESSTGNRLFEYRHAYYTGIQTGCNGSCGGCPVGYIKREGNNYGNCNPPIDNNNNENNCYCRPVGVSIALDGTSDGNTENWGATTPNPDVNSNQDGWYPYAGVPTFNVGGQPGAYIGVGNPYANYLCTNAGMTAPCYLSSGLIRVEDRLQCNSIVQVVTPTGKNKYWSGRVYEGSSYTLPSLGYRSMGYGYLTDYKPFGGIVAPDPQENPYEWDSKEDDSFDSTTIGIQPLYTEYPNTNFQGGEPYQPRAGSPYNCTTDALDCGSILATTSLDFPYDFYQIPFGINLTSMISRLFAESQGFWAWNPVTTRYETTGGLDWTPPGLCSPPTSRPTYDSNFPNNDLCSVLPFISNIQADGSLSTATVNDTRRVNFTFNSKVDSNQLPLIMYEIDWGDNTNTSVSGVEMRDKPNTSFPHSLYHVYNYWSLKIAFVSGVTSIECADAGLDTVSYTCLPGGACQSSNYCVIQPKVKIKDNWGWCSEGIDDITGAYEVPTSLGDCNQWQEFGNGSGWIVVTEIET